MEDDAFSLISDLVIREIIEEYWHQANRTRDCEIYAGAVFLYGAVLEGLLAWAIISIEEEARDKFPENFKKGPIEKFSLGSLIEISVGLELIGPKRVHWLKGLQDFRNFIHPYNLANQSARPNERLARMAYDGVHFALESLKERLSKRGLISHTN